MSLFSKAKATAKTTTTKTKEKKASCIVNDPDFFDKVRMLEMLQDNMKRDKAKADMLSDEIKEVSKDEWVSLYEKTGVTAICWIPPPWTSLLQGRLRWQSRPGTSCRQRR